jgi:hypothetical protein
MALLALASLLFGVFYRWVLSKLINPAIGQAAEPPGVWSSWVATVLILVGIALGVLVYLVGRPRKSARKQPMFVGGETLEAESARVRGTHFYDTVSELPLVRAGYTVSDRGFVDPYRVFGKLGHGVTFLLRWLHSGILSTYLLWSFLGVLILLALGALLWWR